MQADDQLAEWLVRWEEARDAGRPPPALDQLPAELRRAPRRSAAAARLRRDGARPDRAPRRDAPQAPPDTPRYRFEAFLARGGMGEVWRGFDTRLARRWP